MSGIYIPGVEKPSACVFCPVVIDGGVDFSFCPFGHKRVENPMAVMPDCPLVPVPDHGRLIDKTVMCNECRRIAEEYDGIYPDCTYCPAHFAPTIIPADKAEEGK